MSWFDTAGIANLAKTALTTAQKTIDKALDIQENHASTVKTTKKKPDADNFFEAFGLSDQPTSSQPAKQKPNTAIKTPNTPSSSQENLAFQGTSFWTDTWGSFFEMKAQNSSSQDSKKETDNEKSTSPDNETIKDAVLSQPHRANPFPGESHTVLDTSKDLNLIDEENITSRIESKCEVKKTLDITVDNSNSLTSSESKRFDNEENRLEEQVVLVLPEESELEKPALSLLDDTSHESMESSTCDSESNATEVPVADECKTVICDKIMPTEIKIEENETEAVICKQPQTISEVDLALEESPFKQLEESEFFPIEVQALSQSSVSDSSNQKPESEYDVIEMSDQSLRNTDGASESFTRSASVEAIESISQCSIYTISNSTIEIPDIPASVADNIISWDYNTPNKLTYSENYSQDSNYNEEGKPSLSEHLSQMASPESSFHTISSSSFSGNQKWAQSASSSHFINESSNSSNGEQNSHHSDGSSNSSKDDDDTDTAEVKECEVKSSSSSGSHGTSSSSFVKCSMEEAENGSHRAQSPASTVASDRSDATKQESEQNTSGDENETATSSDIEILSPPNGENDRNSSPLKHIWLSRPLRSRRSESPTSDSSKDSLMPVVSEVEEVYNEMDSGSPTMLVNESDEIRCHKRSESNDVSCMDELLQQQDELQAVLDAREKKILEFSKENIELQENEQRLKNLIQKMREEQIKESKDITDLTKQFTHRLAQVEDQLKQATKERDLFKIESEEAKKEISLRICASDIEELIKEKDQQIKELTEEGQKLSKMEFKHTTIIKRLRAKEDEMERTITSNATKLEENSKEVERLRKSISAKEVQEKKHIDAIQQLSNTEKKNDKEIELLKSTLEDRNEKEQTLKKSLDSTYMDLLVLRKSYELKEKEIEDLKSGLEVEANDNLKQKLENTQKEAAKEKEMLIMQMQELRSSITRTEQEYNLREKMFKADISSLQQRLQEADERNEDLTKNMSSASRPLVRQMENLQATFNSQISSWEKVERNLTDRLSDVQNQLALCTEKERVATEKYLDLSSKVTAYESQNSTLRQEKMQLSSELETFKAKCLVLEEKCSHETFTIDKIRQSLLAEINNIKKEKGNVENTMATCLEQLEIEKRRVFKLEEEIKFRDARALVNQNISPCPSPTGSLRSSVGSIHNWSQDEVQDKGSSTPINNYRMSVYDSLRLGSGSSLLENLQSQLKQREGEIVQIQSEISRLEKDKELMAKELVDLSEQNEDLQTKLEKLEAIEKEHKVKVLATLFINKPQTELRDSDTDNRDSDLDQKYNTLLQMYGEKVEETEELHLDLADVKSMYKAQIEELLRSN